MYPKLIDAIENMTLENSVILAHELINDMHDAHYATLKYLIKHLAKIATHEQSNKMNRKNLSIVWGPNLIHINVPGKQALIIDFIIAHSDIFF